MNQDRPEKVWLILGHRPARNPRQVAYSTDPRHYGLPVLKSLTDEEYSAVSNHVAAFIDAADAIDFCYECGLLTTVCRGFRLRDGEYVEDKAVADEVLDTNW